MRTRCLSFICGLALPFLLVPAALAATEVGSNCKASGGVINDTGATVVPLAHDASSPLPLAAPSAGVLTRWKVRTIEVIPAGLTQQLKVLRPSQTPRVFFAVGESTTEAIGVGENSFPTRIPVRAGDRFGLFGAAETLFCIGGAGDVFGVTEASTNVGDVRVFDEVDPGFGVPVVAVVEPDADGDRFGDETQDRCPQGAAVQVACPRVTVRLRARAGRGSVAATVSVTSRATVEVSGAVQISKGQHLLLHSPKRAVSAGGKGSNFTLRFPAKLRKALAGLGPRRSLRLTISATASDVIGRTTSDTAVVLLKH